MRACGTRAPMLSRARTRACTHCAHAQEHEQFGQQTRELKLCQGRLEGVQRAIEALGQERDDLQRLVASKEQLIASQLTQIEQLGAARERLQLQNAQLEAAVKDVDTHKQLDLQRTQYEQVRACVRVCMRARACVLRACVKLGWGAGHVARGGRRRPRVPYTASIACAPTRPVHPRVCVAPCVQTLKFLEAKVRFLEEELEAKSKVRSRCAVLAQACCKVCCKVLAVARLAVQCAVHTRKYACAHTCTHLHT